MRKSCIGEVHERDACVRTSDTEGGKMTHCSAALMWMWESLECGEQDCYIWRGVSSKA
jgi:hypothetical protein